MMPLRARLVQGRPLVMPGVYDALSALIAERAGFEGLFLSGSALSYSLLGRPDIGLVTLTEISDALARIRDRVDIPILVDADSGFGNAMNVGRTVRLLEQSGASVIQIEDQINHKKPGALLARPLVSAEEMVGKIKAAVDARRSENTLISARSDAPFTASYDEVITRAEVYVEAGADIIFIEGFADIQSLKRMTEKLHGRKPLLHNLLDGGASPIQSVDHAAELGFSIVLFPGVGVQSAASAMEKAFATLSQDGSTAALRGAIHDAKSLNTLIGTPSVIAQAKKYE